MSAPDFSSSGLTLKPVPRCRGWFRGPVVEDTDTAKELAAQLRASPAAQGHGVLVGWRGSDEGHRIYVTPPLSARELVEVFLVGSEEGGEPMVARTADRVEAADKICPLVITFADSKGLHAEFTRRLDEEAAARIEALWPFDDALWDGLEGYASDYEGEGPLMVLRLVEEQALQLWWD